MKNTREGVVACLWYVASQQPRPFSVWLVLNNETHVSALQCYMCLSMGRTQVSLYMILGSFSLVPESLIPHIAG